jgi:hypothetical protein
VHFQLAAVAPARLTAVSHQRELTAAGGIEFLVATIDETVLAPP